MSDLFSYLFIIFWTAIIGLLCLASFNASLGVRRKYVDILLKIFEFGRIKIEKAEKRLKIEHIENECNDLYHSVIDKKVNMGPLPSQLQVPGIKRNRSYNTLKQEFDLFDVADFVKAGVEAIIEDEVTKRFSAEELPSWNLLTRTNKNYGFVSFRLSILWGVGCVLRYCILLPVSIFTAGSLSTTNSCQNGSMRIFVNMGIFPDIGKQSIVQAVASIHILNWPSHIWKLFTSTLTGLCTCEGRLLFITVIGVGWLIICTTIIGYIPEGRFKKWLYWHVSLMCFRILARSFSAIVTYHNRENRANGGGICVANHTSPIDVVILACDNCYALVGQKQGGFLGILQRALARATSHVWFERFEMKDRALVTKRLKEHCEDAEKLPILIFPEGTCINNTSVMMFKKGSFEVGGTIYPAAIKYDPRFGDPFWNSSKQGYVHYLLMMMSSWAIVCDVWYLPPMTKQEGENAIDFAKRVKSIISRQGGLVDLEWDGQLKRVQVKKEWKELQQQEYSRKLMGDEVILNT